MELNKNRIPSLELRHNGEKVSFAFRTMEEIHAHMGEIKDVPHRHDYYTILWASNACGDHFIDYKQHLIRPNTIFFVNPGQVHQVITFGNPEGYVIMFTREYLNQNMISEDFLTNLGLFSESADTPPLIINDESDQNLRSIVQNIESAFRRKESFWQEQLSSYLKLLLIECNKLAPQMNNDNPQRFQASRNILKNFKSTIEVKFKEWHKVSYYAEELNISPDYLNSVVKTSIGKTAKEFIQNRLVLEAKRLGVHTQLSTKEIAFDLGFEDPSHFSKFFKNCEGSSFSEFRKSVEESIIV